jgi:AhpD family alkylhydroperoxidase
MDLSNTIRCYINFKEKIMSAFKLHTIASAPAASVPILEAALKGLGFIPNLFAHMATSPSALGAYSQLAELLKQSSLTPEEQQAVLLAVSVENSCEYCVAVHSFLARNLFKVADEKIRSLRDSQPMADAKLNALVEFARAIVVKRGWVSGSQELKDFFAAGYTQQNALDVVLAVSMKTLSNYANHLIDTPLDDAFAAEAWQTSDEYACCTY